MRRLYQQIYLTIIVSLLVVVVLVGALWRLGSDSSPPGQAFRMAGELIAAALPPADAPRATQQQAMEQLADRLGTDLALFDRNGAPVAAAGRPLPAPSKRRDAGGWTHAAVHSAWSIRLPDGRWFVLRAPAVEGRPGLRLIALLGGIGLAVAACAYPVVRRLTRRLERLQAAVETLGAGDLAARVTVEGKDEVARLAESFNRAAERIQELLGAYRLLLANASHELRTPLSRIRLGIELLKAGAEPTRKAELERDIAELDQLIDEILLASRLDAVHAVEIDEPVDLLALCAEECARYDECTLEGELVTIRGDPRLLRRLLRNLLENARDHGAPPVRIELRRDGSKAVLEVSDLGPGIPEAERERVFTPFHRLAGTRGIGGTGLGLSLVRQIASLHGGEAHVISIGGGRSGFRIVLPAAGT